MLGTLSSDSNLFRCSGRLSFQASPGKKQSLVSLGILPNSREQASGSTKNLKLSPLLPSALEFHNWTTYQAGSDVAIPSSTHFILDEEKYLHPPWRRKAFQIFFPFPSQELAETTVVAKVNGELWDLDRPLEGDATVELLTFEDEEAQAVSVWKPANHTSSVYVVRYTMYRVTH